MKPILILGVVLLVLGAVVLVRGGTFTTRRDVVKLGDVKITADEQHPISPWVGGILVLAGVGTLVAGATGKGR